MKSAHRPTMTPGCFSASSKNDLALRHPHEVPADGPVVSGRRRKGIGEPVARLFAVFGDVLLGKAALFRHFFDEFLIVTGDAELFRHFLGDRASAAAEFTADGDDPVLHGTALLIIRARALAALGAFIIARPAAKINTRLEIFRILKAKSKKQAAKTAC